MLNRTVIESQIRETLEQETRAISLSQKLFGPNGLFPQLGVTEDERRKIIQTDLYRRAQARLTELQEKEAADFSRTADQTQSFLAGAGAIQAGIRS